MVATGRHWRPKIDFFQENEKNGQTTKKTKKIGQVDQKIPKFNQNSAWVHKQSQIGMVQALSSRTHFLGVF